MPRRSPVALVLFLVAIAAPIILATPTKEEVRAALVSGDPSTGERLARERWRAEQQQFGEQSVEGAVALEDVVEALVRQGRSGEAATFALVRESLKLKQHAHATRAQYAVSVGQFALVASFAGRPGLIREIEPLARSLLGAAPGSDSAAVATAFVNISNLALRAADYELALRFADAAVPHADPKWGLSSQTRAAVFTNRGTALYALARFDEARRDLHLATSIQETLPGISPLQLVPSLSNLASLESDAGNLDQALQLSERALTLLRGVPDHGADLLQVLCNAAVMRAQLGDTQRAKIDLDEALHAAPAIAGSDLFRSYCLFARGSLFEDLRQFDGAEVDLTAALRLRSELMGIDHPMTKLTALRLAGVRARRNPARELADEYIQTAHGYAKSVSPGRDTVGAMLTVSRNLEEMRQFESARSFAGIAADSAQRSSVKGDFNWGAISARLARLEYRANNFPASRRWALRSEQQGLDVLQNILMGLPETTALQFVSSRSSGLDTLVSLAERAATSDRRAIDDAWSAVIRARGVVTDGLIRRYRALRAAHVEGDDDLLARFLRNQQRLAELKVTSLSTDQRAAARTRLAELEDEEARLMRQMPVGMRDEQAFTRDRDVGLRRVVASIPARSSLVAFVRYDSLVHDDEQYGVFVKGPADAEPRFQALGAAAKIDALVERWRESMLPDSAGLHLPSDEQNESRGVDLRRAVWDPWHSAVAGSEAIYIVADGALHHAMFEALPYPSGGFVVEHEPLLYHLDAERDLLVSDSKPSGRGLLFVGDLEFGSQAPLDETPDEPWSLWRWLGLRGHLPGCVDPIARGFSPLRNSLAGAELAALRSAWPQPNAATVADVSALTGRDATKERLRESVQGKRALHFATHGFVADPGWDGTTESAVNDSTNPLHLAGLALSGANQLRSHKPDEPIDGVLLGDEAATLDLSGVEWVTLSACDTGIGPAIRNEGLLSLRRAFIRAGAKSVVSSLWPVEDRVAVDWMSAFYRARLKNGVSTAAAARTAQLELLEARRNAGESTHPFWWAGFVASGR